MNSHRPHHRQEMPFPVRAPHPHPHSPWNFRELSSLGQSAGLKPAPCWKHAAKHCGYGLPCLTRGKKNKDLHMCSTEGGR